VSLVFVQREKEIGKKKKKKKRFLFVEVAEI
jgi:hypothetical protein